MYDLKVIYINLNNSIVILVMIYKYFIVVSIGWSREVRIIYNNIKKNTFHGKINKKL